MDACHSASKGDITYDTSRYELIYPDLMPSCFVKIDNIKDYCVGFKTIKLYKGAINSSIHLKCHICSPENLTALRSAVKDKGHIVNAKIVQAHSHFGESNISFPRLPHINVNETSTLVEGLHYADFSDPDLYLKYVQELAESFVKELNKSSLHLIRLNVERFYDSIYTHAWTWLTTSKVFQNFLKKERPNLFEQSFAALKAGVNYGIVCGPMVTHDLAEDFLVFITKEILSSFKLVEPLQEIKIIRRLDTFNIQTSCDASIVRNVVEDVLDEFNLSLRRQRNAPDNKVQLKEYLNCSEIEKYSPGFIDEYDSDLVALLMYKKARESNYNKEDVEFVVDIIARVAEIIPIVCEILVDDYQSFKYAKVRPNMDLLLLRLLQRYIQIDCNSLQYMHLIWAAMCCDIHKDDKLFKKSPNKMPSLLLHDIMTKTRNEKITDISTLDLMYKKDLNEFYTSQLCNIMLHSLKLHRLLKVAVIGSKNAELFADHFQKAAKCTVDVLEASRDIKKYDYVIKQTDGASFTRNKDGIFVDFNKWKEAVELKTFQEFIKELRGTCYRGILCKWQISNTSHPSAV
eukprot:NODE_457_length_7221_cov_0.242207.p1 type:complete len:572 gc:universal NODE_457_length_7221_cov_0.242207:2333-4048(+)